MQSLPPTRLWRGSSSSSASSHGCVKVTAHSRLPWAAHSHAREGMPHLPRFPQTPTMSRRLPSWFPVRLALRQAVCWPLQHACAASPVLPAAAAHIDTNEHLFAMCYIKESWCGSGALPVAWCTSCSCSSSPAASGVLKRKRGGVDNRGAAAVPVCNSIYKVCY